MKCSHCGVENPSGMRFCGACGGVLVASAGPAGGPGTDRGAQRRHVTALFCDLVESTPLAASLDPEDYRDLLAAYRRACTTAIERFDGYIAQYLGDGLVVYFGYPRAHEDGAQRAVHAGLEILEEIAALNGEIVSSHGVLLQVRIGVHSGLVVASEMGAGNTAGERPIIGETPHLAARLQSIAPPGSVVISDSTGALVGGYFETESLGVKELEGVARPVGVHRVVRPSGAESRFELAGVRRLTPIVNRHFELARLMECWQEARLGQGRLVHLKGEAGIGKSRLVFELRDRLGQQLGAVQTWQCSAHRRTTPLYPVIRFLERSLGIAGPQSADDPVAVLEQTVRGAGIDAAHSVPLLADLLSLPGVRRETIPHLAAREFRAATLHLLESLLVADPAHHPLLLVVEDLHWADPTTLELLDRILASLDGTPILCVLTFRREFKPASSGRRPDIELELGPLESTEVRELAMAASAGALDEDVLDWVDSAADGVPLFVEEMLKMLDLEGGGAGRSAATDTVVPATLQGLLAERLDRLADLGEVIDAAAVLGREFDRQLLEALTPLRGAQLEAGLSKLAAEDLLRPVEAGARCEWGHALLQEAAYERLVRGRRRALHGRVAEILTQDSATAAARPEVIAHHWFAAAEPANAVRYWHAAGIRALDRAAFLEAAEHFRRGLEALDAAGPDGGDDLVRVDLLTHRAASLQAARGYAAPGVDDAYAKARALCERVGARERLAAVIRGEWLFHLLRSDYKAALELAGEMLALGERSGDRVEVAEGHLFRGFPEMYLAEFDRAREDFVEALAHYRRPVDSDQIYEAQGDTGVMALAYLALVLWNLGYAVQSRERSDLSLELVKHVGGPVTRALAWGMRSILHLSRSEHDELRHWVQLTAALCGEHNIGYWQTVSSVLTGWLEGRAGALERGISRLEESIDDYLRSGSRLSLPHFCIYLADLRLAAGDRARALDALRIGEEHIEATGERFAESELFRFKGRVLMAGESPDQTGATAAYERAVSAARAQNAKLLELRAATRLALHLRNLDEAGAALDELAAVCGWFGPELELADLVRARELLAREGVTP